MTKNNPEIIQAKITSKAYAYIQAVNTDVDLSEPVFAINWFNTKALWLYNLYNLLASVSVKKVGGYPFFKGRVQEVLSGDPELYREVLLIVNYPSANHFARMMENAYFKLVSLFRIMAVKDFTFGHSQPINSDQVTHDDDKDKAYVMLHYRADYSITQELMNEVEANTDVEIFYAGQIAALVYAGDSEKAREQIPCLMDGVFLLRADHLEQIKSFTAQDAFKNTLKETETYFLATLERIL